MCNSKKEDWVRFTFSNRTRGHSTQLSPYESIANGEEGDPSAGQLYEVQLGASILSHPLSQKESVTFDGENFYRLIG